MKWSLSYVLIKQKRRRQWTNVPLLLAILIAMAVWRCNTARIAWWRRFRAFIKATKRCHRATTCSVSPQQQPGRQKTKWHCKMCPLCWPFWLTWQCNGTLLGALPDGGGPGLSWKPLNAAIGHALAPIEINWTCLPLNLGAYFIVTLSKKSSSLYFGP